jgi:hypothetical protein
MSLNVDEKSIEDTKMVIYGIIKEIDMTFSNFGIFTFQRPRYLTQKGWT